MKLRDIIICVYFCLTAEKTTLKRFAENMTPKYRQMWEFSQFFSDPRRMSHENPEAVTRNTPGSHYASD